jgi:hypothetical protein
MKKCISFVLCAALISSPLFAREEIDDLAVNTDNLYRVSGEDGAFTPLGVSIMGWGIGLGIGIGLLCALVHHSTAPSSTPAP